MITIQGMFVAIGDTPILHGISLEVRSGETVAIVGESGSGKTTLLHAIAGLRAATAGSVRIGGDSAEQALHKGAVAYLFQRPALAEWLTARENVRVPLRVGRTRGQMDRVSQKALVAKALELAHISEAGNKYPRQLSGGMRARVALAAALVRRPTILLLDEPFGSLDTITQETVIVDIAPVLAGTTCVLVTHNLEEALLLADRIVLLALTKGGGTVVAEHSLSEDKPRGIEYLSSGEAIAAGKLLRAQLFEYAEARHNVRASS